MEKTILGLLENACDKISELNNWLKKKIKKFWILIKKNIKVDTKIKIKLLA